MEVRRDAEKRKGDKEKFAASLDSRGLRINVWLEAFI